MICVWPLIGVCVCLQLERKLAIELKRQNRLPDAKLALLRMKKMEEVRMKCLAMLNWNLTGYGWGFFFVGIGECLI